MISRVAMLGDEPGSIIIIGIKEKNITIATLTAKLSIRRSQLTGHPELLLILSYYVLDLEHISLPATVTFAARWTKY
jgi:hypothetical protein